MNLSGFSTLRSGFSSGDAIRLTMAAFCSSAGKRSSEYRSRSVR